MTAKRLLILAGTSEAATLARLVADTFGRDLDVISSFAGRLLPPPSPPGRIRVGGFGGTEGLADYLLTERIDMVVDATHPFAAVISANCAAACATVGIPRLMVVRPPWHPEVGDRWHNAADLREAAHITRHLARRPFLATGISRLDEFGGMPGIRFVVRLFRPPPAPLPMDDYTVISAKPPYSVESEARLMRGFGIDVLICKQSGGTTSAKLIAARELGLPVIMVSRPGVPEGPATPNAEAAMDWLAKQLSRSSLSWG